MVVIVVAVLEPGPDTPPCRVQMFIFVLRSVRSDKSGITCVFGMDFNITLPLANIIIAFIAYDYSLTGCTGRLCLPVFPDHHQCKLDRIHLGPLQIVLPAGHALLSVCICLDDIGVMQHRTGKHGALLGHLSSVLCAFLAAAGRSFSFFNGSTGASASEDEAPGWGSLISCIHDAVPMMTVGLSITCPNADILKWTCLASHVSMQLGMLGVDRGK